MKLSFASALAVGVTSQAEYMDIEFKEEVDLNQGVQRLAATLPLGIRINSGKIMPAKMTALMAIVNLATYDVLVPSKAGEFASVEDSLKRFNEAQEVLYTRETPKGRKEIEVKQYMARCISAIQQDNQVLLVMDIKITATGSIKPGEVLAALVTMFELNVDKDRARINRTGLYVADDKNRVKPIDL